MENTLLRMAIAAAAMFAFLALPSVAAAETIVPPGNSAAMQYTETFPTTGGNAEVNSSIGGGGSRHGGGRSPSKVLGSHTAQQLESHGSEGRTVAALATEGAPSGAAEGGGSGGSNGSGGAGKGEAGSGTAASAGGAGKGAPPSGPGGGGGAIGSLAAEAPAGSSGLSEVLSHATGSSSGEMGIFLPLVLLAIPLGALLYAWRRRQPDRAAH